MIQSSEAGESVCSVSLYCLSSFPLAGEPCLQACTCPVVLFLCPHLYCAGLFQLFSLKRERERELVLLGGGEREGLKLTW